MVLDSAHAAGLQMPLHTNVKQAKGLQENGRSSVNAQLNLSGLNVKHRFVPTGGVEITPFVIAS